MRAHRGLMPWSIHRQHHGHGGRNPGPGPARLGHDAGRLQRTLGPGACGGSARDRDFAHRWPPAPRPHHPRIPRKRGSRGRRHWRLDKCGLAPARHCPRSRHCVHLGRCGRGVCAHPFDCRFATRRAFFGGGLAPGGRHPGGAQGLARRRSPAWPSPHLVGPHAGRRIGAHPSTRRPSGAPHHPSHHGHGRRGGAQRQPGTRRRLDQSGGLEKTGF